MKFRRSLWIVALLGTAVILLIIFALAMMGPQFGSVFSNIVSNLDMTSVSGSTQQASAPTRQAAVPTQPPATNPPVSAVPTQPPTTDSQSSTVPTQPPTTDSQSSTVPTQPAATNSPVSAVPTQPPTTDSQSSTVPTQPAATNPPVSAVPTQPPATDLQSSAFPTEEDPGDIRPTDPPTAVATAVATAIATAVATATEGVEYADEPTMTAVAQRPTDTVGNDTSPPTPTQSSSGTGNGDQPSSTALPETEEAPEVMEVASLPLSIVSVSGEIIGNGTLRVYAPESVNYPQTTRVELELRLDNRYITPTPFGQVTVIPVTQITSTPRPGRPTPTERVPIHESTGLDIHQRMGASLTCLSTSFTGCDASHDPATARIIGFNGANWAWIIAPQEDVRGWQDLNLELWTISRIGDGPEQANVVWDYAFQIEANADAANPPITAGIVAATVAILALIVLAVLALRGWKTGQTPPQGETKPKPKVFISYRRKASWIVARTIHDTLTQRGADVFIDVDDINEGRFEDIIKRNIEQCDYFILVLSPGTLESEWVIKEAAYALSLDRRIIPVLADGFNLYEHELPAALQGIQSHNAITLTPEFFNAAMDKLAQFIGV